MGLSLTNCRKVMTACVQSVALYGSELWWKISRQSKGRADKIQKLVNQEIRVVTGCFRTTNVGVLALEAGLRPAVAQLDNRQRRYGIRLSGLPEGDHAKLLVGAKSAIGKRLQEAIGYAPLWPTSSEWLGRG
jgi:hypothetical protein